ncbi:type IV secretion system protein [Lysobacter sp. K5869]|uniref:type IV secretion system protein n=1 Tax=Lysobacter sp. K5869 TaxID=2820808 RepID=UPI001C05F360|nr:type IV secretion system protein [Lysobacter sp. K5869]QWP75711.1 type IV secretion system protein [Lysobacter sp. K5869]
MHLIATSLDWLLPQAQGIGDYVFFKLINEYFNQEIDQFGLSLMRRTMAWAAGIAQILVTLWLTIAGYRIVTGQSREPMMGLVVGGARIAVIVAVATGMSFGGASLHRFFTQDLDREIHALFTAQEGSSAEAIDRNLAYMQVALNAIDAIQVPSGDEALQERKRQALLFAGLGTAGPPMVAGAMLLLYKFTLALFIGLGPLFVLCLIFDQTKDLFRKWLMYGLGTLFSMATLSVVTAMTMKLLSKIAVALWLSKATGLLGSASEGLSAQAMQQGGIGLLMSVLLISVPPAAAMFFQGTVGSFNSYSQLGGKPPADSGSGGVPRAYDPGMPREGNRGATPH